MTKPLSTCTGCSLFSSKTCPHQEAPESGDCSSFLSWSDQLHQESAAIEKAQRVAWLLLFLTSALAAVVILLPEIRA